MYLSFPPQATMSVTGIMSFTNANTHSGQETYTGSVLINAKIIRLPQTFTSSATISATGSSLVLYTAGSGSTLTLPTTSLTQWQHVTIKDTSGNGFTLNPGGRTIDGSSSNVSIPAYGVTRLLHDGTNWVTL